MTIESRKRLQKVFFWSCRLAVLLCCVTLFLLLVPMIVKGWSFLSWEFLTSYPSRIPARAGILSAMMGTFWIMVLTTIFAVPMGLLTAIYLSEYAPRNSKLFLFLKINIANLAGMPSIVYGLLGLAVFVRFFALDRSLLAGSLTLAILILPVIIISAEEAIKAVPDSLRQGGFALGARKWQVIFGQVMPAAMPGIMTGIILSLSRAIGESAPLILIGALSFVAFTPDSLSSAFTVLPVQIFNWASRPQEDFQIIAGTAIIVLLVILLVLNSIAIYIRNHFQRYKL
jgi:phosphate transport system permease protein